MPLKSGRSANSPGVMLTHYKRGATDADFQRAAGVSASGPDIARGTKPTDGATTMRGIVVQNPVQ